MGCGAGVGALVVESGDPGFHFLPVVGPGSGGTAILEESSVTALEITDIHIL